MFIQFSKVSDVAIKGDSLVVGSGYPKPGTYTPSAANLELEVNTAILIEILATPAKKNRIFLRGLTLDAVVGREYQSTGPFDTPLQAWITILKTGPMVRTANKPITKPKVYTYANAINAYIGGVTARRPGRPFVLPRGRKFAHRHA
jgi:hypothetical protein